MNRGNLLCIVIFSLLSVHSAAASERPIAESVLMFGTVASARYIENRGDHQADTIDFGAILQTRLKDLEVLRGSYEATSVTVNLVASNRGYLKRKNKILLFVKFDDQKKITQVDWWPMTSFACVDSASIEKYNLGDIFKDAIRDDHYGCISD